MAKRQAAKITVRASEELPEEAPKRLQCIHDSKLIIPPHMTVTNQRYEFEAGEIQAVHPLDYNLLLSLERKASGCCGGGLAESKKYFREVD